MPEPPEDLVTTVLAPEGSGGHATEIAGVELAVVDGPDCGLRAHVASETARAGTASGNHLRLTDRAVSRVHCELRLGAAGVRIVDAGSTNGTFVGGVRVFDAELPVGAVFTLGASAVRVEASRGATRVPFSPRDAFGELLGSSLAMRRVYAVLERLAASDTTALIHGETGTGKELAARAVHEASRRAGKPFVTVDCGALAESLVESEIFGHVRGAFSGALADRPGLFEAAQGGTLFLDEIGELPLALQPKLLRVLESREVRRVGANASRPVDVRVLAATHRSLARAVNEGAFREDLYYRLAVVEVELPPLRARREDIAAIARRFYERFGGEGPLPADLEATVVARAWSGNVRELRNFVERAVTLGRGWDAVAPPPSGETPDAGVPVHLPLKEARVAWMEQFERRYVEALLRRTGGNVTRAAEIAGVHRRSLQRVIASLGGRIGDAPAPDEDP